MKQYHKKVELPILIPLQLPTEFRVLAEFQVLLVRELNSMVNELNARLKSLEKEYPFIKRYALCFLLFAI